MKKKKKRIQESKPDLEMTPMIDVVFNLLIFFMCSPFKVPEGQLDAFLPKDQGLQNFKIEKKDEEKVVVFIKESGSRIPDIYMGRSPLEKTENGEPRFDILAERLRDIMNMSGSQPVEIQSDRKIEYAYVMGVLNACTKAEIEDIRFSLPMGASKILEAQGKL